MNSASASAARVISPIPRFGKNPTPHGYAERGVPAMLRKRTCRPSETAAPYRVHPRPTAAARKGSSVIDRRRLIQRHRVVVTELQPSSTLSLGNGEFAVN